ncbi:MAG: glycosyltransferase family 4 protein [Arenicellales bacterium]
MHIAFYAPMKSPRSARPSGDRKIGALFMSALDQAGLNVSLASEFRSWEGTGDRHRQESIRQQACAIANELIEQYLAMAAPQRPKAWFTYHLYHKAPDWIGPRVCAALQIPYLLAEASVGHKQAGGKWDMGYQASVESIHLAQAIFTLNPVDLDGIQSVARHDQTVTMIYPFLDVERLHLSDKIQLRHRVATKMKIDPDRYWLLSVAMMRNDSKLISYELLARSVQQLQRKDWLLLLIGDGAAELLVREYFRFDLDRRVYFLGKRDQAFIREVMSAADLLVWPAVNEAIGMVALESLACGLPVIWGKSGGIEQIVRHRKTGILIDQTEASSACAEFAENIELLLSNPGELSKMSAASLDKYHRLHRLEAAAQILGDIIHPLLNQPHRTKIPN